MQAGDAVAGGVGASTHPAGVGTSASAAAGEAEAPKMSGDDEGPLRFQGRNLLDELHEFRTEDEDALYEDVDETQKHLIGLVKVRFVIFVLIF